MEFRAFLRSMMLPQIQGFAQAGMPGPQYDKLCIMKSA